jgi:signal transduction histidine kinase
MKRIRIGVAIFAFSLIGIAVFARILIQDGQKKETHDVQHKGAQLISLLALHSIEDFDGDNRNFILRTLKEYASSEGLVYCFVHDHAGNSLTSVVPYDLAAEIPNHIETKSLYTMGPTRQTFQPIGSKDVVYEFSKPLFEGGQRAGTVRIGLRATTTAPFSLERVRLLAMVALFLLATASFTYYGISRALEPLKHLNQNLKNICQSSDPTVADSAKNGGVISIVQDLELALGQLKEKLDQSEIDTVELTSKLGVIAFEKNQIINIFDSMDFGIIITDSQDNVIHINAYLLNLIGRKWSEATDRPLSEIFEQNLMTSFISLQQAMRQGTSMNRLEVTLPEIAPEQIFQLSLSYVKDGDGVFAGQMILIKDITNEKLADKTKHEFLCNVTHELLTPLMTIKSYNEMLMEGEVDTVETQKEFYNTINEETERLTQLIKNLVNISKIEDGSLQLNKDLVRIDSLVNDCILAVETSAKKKHIVIDRHLPNNITSIVGDKDLLRMAIINILSNAVKYTPENGTIFFALTDQDDAIAFEINDTGYGISQEDLPYIFDRSYRSSDTDITKHPGTGLGLTITSEIVHLHGGQIEVQSEPGEGTQFTIRIPKEEYYLAEQQEGSDHR